MMKKGSPTVLSNRLYYGDCHTIKQEMPVAGVGLICLDPHFNSTLDCNPVCKDGPLSRRIEA